MKVIETVEAVWNRAGLEMGQFPLRKATSFTITVFDLLVPLVFEYSHERHAKKNTSLQRSVMGWTKLSSCGSV